MFLKITSILECHSHNINIFICIHLYNHLLEPLVTHKVFTDVTQSPFKVSPELLPQLAQSPSKLTRNNSNVAQRPSRVGPFIAVFGNLFLISFTMPPLSLWG